MPFVKASTIAHEAGRQVALTLSDSFCVDRYRGEFLDLMRNRHRRSGFRQRGRIAFAVPDVGFRYGAEAIAD